LADNRLTINLWFILLRSSVGQQCWCFYFVHRKHRSKNTFCF